MKKDNLDLIEKSCAFTGHRPDRLGGYDWMNEKNLMIMRKLRTEVLRLIEEENVERFVFGGAIGIDQMAYAVCQKIKRDKHPHIKLSLAIPFEEQHTNWPNVEDVKRYLKQKEDADEVVIVDTLKGTIYTVDKIDSGGYHYVKMALRNKYMVDQARFLISVWDGEESGGTYSCIKYFKSKRKPKDMIHINPSKLS